MTQFVRRYRLWILGAITLLGAAYRFWRIDSLPPGDGYDVSQYGLDALQILDGARPIYLLTNFGREVLFSYLVAIVYLFTGPGALGIHLSSAIIGTATIPAVYLAARAVFAADRGLTRVWGPLLAALATAVSYWHLNWSRAGLRVIWVPFFAALIAASLWHGLQNESKRGLAVTGVLLGLSMYTYQAARLLPLLVLFGFIITYISRRTFTRHDLAGLSLTFGLALLVITPLIFFTWQNPGVLNDRLRQATLIDGEGSLGEQISGVLDQSEATLKMFFIQGDDEPLYTIPGRPSLMPFFAGALILGIAAGLWRWKRPPYLYLLMWLILLTLPAMVAGQAATAKRALGAFPAVAVLLSLGLVWPLQALILRKREMEKSSPRRAALLGVLGALWGLAILGGFSWTAVQTVRDYFIIWGQDPSLPAHFQRDHTEVGLYIGSLPVDEQILVSPFDVSHPAIQLYAGQGREMRNYDGHFCLPLPNIDTTGVTYIVVPGAQEQSLSLLAGYLPGGEKLIGPERSDRQEPYFEVYRVAAGASPEIAPQFPTNVIWNEEIQLIGYDLGQDDIQGAGELVITFYYQALQTISTDYTRFVHLSAGANSGEAGALWGQEDSQPCQGAMPTSTWKAGDIIIDMVQMTLDGDLPSSELKVSSGFYTWPDLTRLPVTNGVGGRTAFEAVIGEP